MIKWLLNLLSQSGYDDKRSLYNSFILYILKYNLNQIPKTMKKLLIALVIIISNIYFAQEMRSYKNKGNKIEFEVSKTEFFATFSEKNENVIRSRQSKLTKLSNSSAILSFTDTSGDFNAKKKNLLVNKTMPLKKVEPVLIYKDGTRQIIDGQINLKLNVDADIKSIVSNFDFNIEQNEFDKNIYLLKSSSYSTEEILEIVNQLQKRREIEFAEPNFIRIMSSPVTPNAIPVGNPPIVVAPQSLDPLFYSQWAIKNTGQYGGTPGADMKVENAWKYSNGNGIKVAIIDEGVDLAHPDLLNNLLPGYDATGNNSNGAPSGNDAHGTACAGIVAAVANNNIGTAGIAFNAKILPVRIAFQSNGSWVSTNDGVANGINWAVNNGADILSNSWSGGSNSSVIENAINNAVNNGRGGKGAVVLASTSNYNTSVAFPANLPNVIAVGASSMCDERKTSSSCDGESWWGSNYGAELDIVAPGVMISTADISGSTGYSTGNYISSFNGTSSACPNAAGVVALILSANPNLTQNQARAYLERNADKVLPSTYIYQGLANYYNGTWNNQMGYGRVNAQKAVEDVFFSNVIINGNNKTCIEQQEYTLAQVPAGFVPVWTYSSNLTKISETNTTITVIPNTGEIGDAFVRATFGTKEITKNFWIGPPRVKMPNGSCGNPYDTVCFNYGSYSNTFNAVVDGVGMENFPNNDIDYEWEKVTYGNFTFVSYGNGYYSNVSNNGTKVTGRMAIIQNNGETNIQVRARAKSNCGWGPWKNIIFANYGGKINNEKIFTISPNPSDDIVNITLEGQDSKLQNNSDIQAELYNNFGNKQRSVRFSDKKGLISVKGLLPGVYTLKIIYNDKVENQQVIVK